MNSPGNTNCHLTRPPKTFTYELRKRQREKKTGEEKEEEDRGVSPESKSNLRESNGEAGRTEGEAEARWQRLLQNNRTKKTNKQTLAHFSGTFLLCVRSEGAGGWCGQPLPNVDSEKEEEEEEEEKRVRRRETET